jgi:steroid delta-isomerase-like uncharacterized protein
VKTTAELIAAYFEAFNRHDAEAMLALMDAEVVHEINQGGVGVGVEKFRAFKAHMDRCYREQIREIVIMVNGERGCADFVCDGEYLATDGGLPEAKGQTYSIEGCAIFTCVEGRITKIVSYYNLLRWISLIQ